MRHFGLYPQQNQVYLVDKNENILSVNLNDKSTNAIKIETLNNIETKSIDMIVLSLDIGYLTIVVNGKTIIIQRYLKDSNTWEHVATTQSKKKITCIISDINQIDNEYGCCCCYYSQTDGEIFKWDYSNNSVKELSGHISYLTTMVASPCGKYLITGDRDCCIRVSSLVYPFEIVSFCMGHSGSITSMCIIDRNLSDTSLYMIVSSSAYGELFLWDLTSGRILDQLKLINDTNEAATTTYTDDIKCEDNIDTSNCINYMVYNRKYSTIICIIQKFLNNNKNESIDEIVSICIDTKNGKFLRNTINDLDGSHKYCYGQLQLKPNNEQQLYSISHSGHNNKFYLTNHTLELSTSNDSTIKINNNQIVYEWDSLDDNKNGLKMKPFKSFTGFRLGLNIPPRKRFKF